MAGLNTDVFLNMPFDAAHLGFLRAAVFAVYDCGYAPRCALEQVDSGKIRLDKIYDIIRSCRLGIHDICRAGVDRVTGLARFNVPLELGLFLGAGRFGDALQKRKLCLILDRDRDRYRRFCSDIAGHDIASHGGRADESIVKIRDWLAVDAARSGILVPGGVEMVRRHSRFKHALPALCRRVRIEPQRLTYTDYNMLAVGWLRENSWDG